MPVGFDGGLIDVDAVVVWRVFDGPIHEAWDIPAVNTVRPHQPDRSSRTYSDAAVAALSRKDAQLARPGNQSGPRTLAPTTRKAETW